MVHPVRIAGLSVVPLARYQGERDDSDGTQSPCPVQFAAQKFEVGNSSINKCVRLLFADMYVKSTNVASRRWVR